MNKRQWSVLALCLLCSSPALAYIGPGAGISFLGSLFSTFVVVLLAVGAVLLWPLRYLWRRSRRLLREARGQKEPVLPPAGAAVDVADDAALQVQDATSTAH